MIIKEAQIVFMTLSTSGSEKVKKNLGKVEMLIVDEAAQATELATIIPLFYSPRKVVLVGDRMQLPPCIISKDLGETNMHVSLFERLVTNGTPYDTLDTQYRMCDPVGDFISSTFYGTELKTDDSVKYRYSG